MKITRRQALTGSLATGLAACSDISKPESFTTPSNVAPSQFVHGVASGDPTATTVVLWTRIAPADSDSTGSLPVELELSREPGFETIHYRKKLEARAVSDWTIKHNAEGLVPGATYYYRFKAGDLTSPTGTTKTLPEGDVDQIRLAVVSCASWPHGFFNGYDHISRFDHFDAIINLGDYFYEYGPDQYGGKTGKSIGRTHEPPREVFTLEDYRLRHAQYKTDPALQSIHAKIAMISLWDDHEVANNSWEGGAENHDMSEGDWVERRRAAMQAYYEWMPVRDPEPGKGRHNLYRNYAFGDLLNITTIETRLTARSKQIDVDAYSVDFTSQDDADKFLDEVVGAEDRYLLGDAQLDFIINSLRDSKEKGQKWQVLANQILMADVRTPDLTPYISEEAIQKIEPEMPTIRNFIKTSSYRLPLYIDTWGGYPYARERLYDQLAANGITDMLVLTGDAHEVWVNDIVSQKDQKLGVELGTASITAHTVEDYLGDGTTDFALLMTRENDCVKYYDPIHHGYMDLTITKDKIHSRFVSVDTVKQRDYNAFTTAAVDVVKSKGTLKITNPKWLDIKERYLF